MAKGKYQKWLTKEGLLLIKDWARNGLTDKQIASDKMDIAESTFYVWKNKYSEFSEALKESKPVADAKVVDSMFNSTQLRIVPKRTWTINKETGELEVSKIEEQIIPPDQKAISMWLKNRQRDQWCRENIVEEDTAAEALTIEPVYGSDEE